ncbi:C40 family peptidase [Leptolyngbya sp. PCC 6406]|uniref:C40 family peptidase n=1 Tax=Leptolyngbya sp. PCC 6406 TaxID=1173264 RepID=UPI0002AC9DD8|nr:C40 family peptidase [Leptolyngbya sp. PCC 6406]
MVDIQPDCLTSQGSELRCLETVNLYKTPDCDSLVTQAAAGRQLRVLAEESKTTRIMGGLLPQGRDRPQRAIPVCLCEDDYPGWLAISDLPKLEIAPGPYQPTSVDAATIAQRLPQVIAFAEAAMAQPNEYLWGGTVAPNYDCSGLVQAAFAAVGIQLPRDAYQQQAFVEPIAMVFDRPLAIADLQPGDLIFFGTPEKTTHVALALGAGRYIHSSGKDQGRNGIGIDSLEDLRDPVSARYYAQLLSAGRVIRSYLPQGRPN